MAETVSMPKLGFDMAEGILVRWVKKEGEQVRKGDILADIETDKATVEVESPYDGIVARHLVEQSTSVPVGDPIAIITAPGEAVPDLSEQKPKELPLPAGMPTKKQEDALVGQAVQVDEKLVPPKPASPLARRMAKDHQLNLISIEGSGPNGRVVRRDVEAVLAARESGQAAGENPSYAVGSSQDIRTDEVIPLSKLRSIIARRMVDSKTSIPHFYVTHQFRADRMMSMRQEYNRAVDDDRRLSVNDFIIKAAALALKKYPGINASLSEQGLIRHGRIHIGVAVSVEGGLLTVVVRDADLKPLRQISAEVKEMANRVRQGKVRSEDLEGSTFSISNLGMYDVEAFGAIINPPEAAILAVASVHEAPVVEDGQVVAGQVFKATLSADHRVTDGVEAAQFMQELARYIENPLLMVV